MLKIIDFIKDNEFLNNLLDRSQFEYDEVNKVVDNILYDVKTRKDEALRE